MTAAACARCETVLEHGDLRCAICGLPAPAEAGPVAAYAQILRCGECGAAMAFCAVAGAPRCGFCGATVAIEQPSDPVETAQRWLPFAVDREAAEAAVHRWLSRRGWLAPRQLASEAVLASLSPLSWAAWRVDGEALVTWTADSDAGAERSAWAPHAGECRLTFRDVVVPASRGLRPAECRRLLLYYALGELELIESPGSAAARSAAQRRGELIDRAPAWAMIEQFDLQRSAARGQVREAITALARLRIGSKIPGRRRRNVRVACLVERQATDRIALPVWVLAYRYRGRPYRALVHGQRADVVIGQVPVDWAKIAGIAAVAICLCAILIWLLAGR